MKSKEEREVVSQHLQLVLVVQIYQQLQSLQAIPEKLNQKSKNNNKNQHSCPLWQPHSGGCCFQFKCSFPFCSSHLSAMRRGL